MKIPDNLMLVVVVALIVISFIFYMRANIANDELVLSEATAVDTISLIKKFDYDAVYPQCKSLRPNRFDNIKSCLETINHNVIQEKMFKQDDFNNANPEKNETGYLIVSYGKGAEKLSSDKFLLEHNHKVVDEGCATPGFIERGYTCRLEFPTECEPGDNLEIKYDDARVYLRTC